jgi:ABC-type transport system substrate-binding protein
MQEILIEDVPVLYIAYSPVMIAHRANIGGVRAHSALVHYLFEEWWVK